MANMKKIAVATLLAWSAAPALAQLGPCVATDPPFLAEGPIEGVSAAANGLSGTVTAMGMVITVPEGTPVYTPTADLDMGKFADETPFPGRSQPGFVGGTVISTGCVKTDGDGNLVLLADDVTSDVSENVLLGVVTAPPASNEAPIAFGVLDTTVSVLTDPRMPGKHFNNNFGFEVIPTTVPIGASVAAEGYYGGDNTLHVWSIEVGGGELKDQVNPQVSIQRFRCDGDLRILGAMYLGDPDGTAPAPACNFSNPPYSIKLYNADAGQEIPFGGRDTLDVLNGIAPDMQFCTYSMRLRSISDTACPPNVRVDLLQNGTVIASATTAKEAPAPNGLPVAVADAYAVVGGQTLVVTAPGLLANDVDPDAGDMLTVALVADAQNGELVFGIDEASPGDGSFSYTPEFGFSGIDTFTYRAVDSKGGLSEPVTVTISVEPQPNRAPVASPDAFGVAEDGVLTIPVASLLSNDTDADGNALAVTAVGNAVNGTVTLAGGNVTFTPTANFSGVASFTYTVSDGLATANGSVTVDVTPVNDPALAQNDNATTTAGIPVTINVLGNDFDLEGQALVVANLTQPATGGTVATNGNSVTYTPAVGFSGSTSFTYQAQDSAGALSNVATVTVTVQAPAAVVDLDISGISATSRVQVGQAVSVSIQVRNNSTVNGSATATLSAVSTSGETIPQQTITVHDPVGGRATRFDFPSVTPTRAGTITWTVTIADTNPDIDQASASTRVR